MLTKKWLQLLFPEVFVLTKPERSKDLLQVQMMLQRHCGTQFNCKIHFPVYNVKYKIL